MNMKNFMEKITVLDKLIELTGNILYTTLALGFTALYLHMLYVWLYFYSKTDYEPMSDPAVYGNMTNNLANTVNLVSVWPVLGVAIMTAVGGYGLFKYGIRFLDDKFKK